MGSTKDTYDTTVSSVADAASEAGHVLFEFVSDSRMDEKSPDDGIITRHEEKKIPVLFWSSEFIDSTLDYLATELGESKSYVLRRIVRNYFANHDRRIRSQELGEDYFQSVDPFGDITEPLSWRGQLKQHQVVKKNPVNVRRKRG